MTPLDTPLPSADSADSADATDPGDSTFAANLLRWFDRHGRKSLPWRRPAGRAASTSPNPYPIWVSEIMLQQTRVSAVIPYYQKFIARFPDIAALAGADADEVLHHWSGLGYYARARNLHAAAKQIMTHHAGQFPDEFDQILALPGIGRSTAGAISAFAWGRRRAILDGNVKRVLTRYYAIPGDPGGGATEARLWRIAEELTPHPQDRVGDYTQALMDLGATLCTRTKPSCEACPLAANCRALRRGEPTAFPQRKAKTAAARRRRSTTMLVVKNHRAELLLVKRPPAGIWGGLWSLPEYDGGGDGGDGDGGDGSTPEQWCERQFGIVIQTAPALPPVRHSFTHFDLDILPLPATVAAQNGRAAGSVMDGGEILWYNPKTPARVGLSTAVSRILGISEDSA